jgi:hypothetical protein
VRGHVEGHGHLLADEEQSLGVRMFRHPRAIEGDALAAAATGTRGSRIAARIRSIVL